MTGSDRDLAARYPLLFARQRWEWAGFDASFSTVVPDADLVTNVHVVAFAGERIVLCRDDRDVWFLPGGTREPGESIESCAARELEEEAGARLTGPLLWLGAHRGVSDHPIPYRPHQPHPQKAWLWCTADATIHAAPTTPDGGEQVVEVRAVGAAEARTLLLSDAPWFPDLILLALEMRSLQR